MMKKIICFFKGHLKHNPPKNTIEKGYYYISYGYKKMKKWGLKCNIYKVEVCQRCGKELSKRKIYSDINLDAAQLIFKNL